MWYERGEGWVRIYVRALPNSSKNQIVGVMEDALKIKIKAPAVEGAANKELVKFLSKSFKVPKSSVRFVSGETSKRKRLELPLSEKLEQFLKESDDARESL